MSIFTRFNKLILTLIIFTSIFFPLNSDAIQYYSRTDISYTSPGGIGYEKGYGSVDLFLGNNPIDCGFIFINPQGHFFTDGSVAANVGVGGRYFQRGRIWGANIYYDYRNMPKNHRKEFSNSFHQLGVGIESLGCFLDFRANGYIPLATTCLSTDATFYNFQGNQAFYKQSFLASFGAVDAEVGYTIEDLFCPTTFYVGAGPYYLFKNDCCDYQFEDAIGGFAKVVASYCDWFSLEGGVTFDRNFGTNFYGQITISFPLYNTKERSCCKSTCTWACEKNLDRVRRRPIIPIDDKSKVCPIVDPNSQAPCRIIFVNNSNSGMGSGTFEDPYPTLFFAEDNSLEDESIYVYPGSNPYVFVDQGIALKNSQRLVSSSVLFNLAGFAIPASTPGQKPELSFSSGDLEVPLIVLSNKNEVSGFIIESEGVGIKADGLAGSSNYCIRDNVISTVNKSIFLTLNNNSCVEITNNSMFSSIDTLDINSDVNSFINIGNNNLGQVTTMLNSGGKVVLENNLIDGTFNMLGISPEVALRAVGNISTISSSSDAYILFNSTGSAAGFKLEVPTTGFESINIGRLAPMGDGVDLVPLNSVIKNTPECFCQ